ncbi:MAG: hypothetical protein NVS9B4_04410 [Candidatus Acidiferrum sp.]
MAKLMPKKVYIIGAGPGDPELLTVKAQRILRTADVVFHDELVSPEILGVVRPSAEIQNVGKRCGQKVISQEEINFRVVSQACEGRTVVRLKGGDPLIFGRAGEEMDALRRAGIDFEIVPGITAAFGAAALAQISLTDRRLASKVVFLSNHRCAEKTAAQTKETISKDSTVVMYMPGKDYGGLVERMLSAGLDADTPCLLVSCASTRQERIHQTTLENLSCSPHLSAPVIVVIGGVAAKPSQHEEELVFSGVAPQAE